MFIVLLSLSLIVSLLAWAYASLAHFQKVLPFGHRDNILILTAHPDDECMFFGPTITSLRTLTKARISVLCLSTGKRSFWPRILTRYMKKIHAYLQYINLVQ
jgi:N-acetylglucosaminylphosphatidylinositol deacetylase